MGLTYGTWTTKWWFDGSAPIVTSVLGWSTALSAAVWWLLPDYAHFAPMLNLALNGTTAVYMWVNWWYSGLVTNEIWFLHILTWVACALDIWTLLTIFVFEDDMADDDWEDDWEEPAGCDPYDYYCY